MSRTKITRSWSQENDHGTFGWIKKMERANYLENFVLGLARFAHLSQEERSESSGGSR